MEFTVSFVFLFAIALFLKDVAKKKEWFILRKNCSLPWYFLDCQTTTALLNIFPPYPLSITAFSASKTVEGFSTNLLARKCSEKRNCTS